MLTSANDVCAFFSHKRWTCLNAWLQRYVAFLSAFFAFFTSYFFAVFYKCPCSDSCFHISETARNEIIANFQQISKLHDITLRVVIERYGFCLLSFFYCKMAEFELVKRNLYRFTVRPAELIFLFLSNSQSHRLHATKLISFSMTSFESLFIFFSSISCLLLLLFIVFF